jgi:methionine-rich copper-binding protein CopC
MMQRVWFLTLTLTLVLSLLTMAAACGKEASPTVTQTAPSPGTPTATLIVSTPTPIVTPTPAAPIATATQEPTLLDIQEVKTPHYVKTSIPHGTVLMALPTTVRINFNFTLAPPSQLRVVKGEEPISTSDAISEDRLILSGEVPDSGSGTYVVYYEACWPDGSCHQGQFAFAVM